MSTPVSIFDQDVLWRTRDGRELLLADMESDHLRNTVEWLRTNAARVAEGYFDKWLTYGLMHPVTLPDDVFDALLADSDQAKSDPTFWLLETKLYRALRAELARRGTPIIELGDLFTVGSGTAVYAAVEVFPYGDSAGGYAGLRGRSVNTRRTWAGLIDRVRFVPTEAAPPLAREARLELLWRAGPAARAATLNPPTRDQKD